MPQASAALVPLPLPPTLVGTWPRFGTASPVYEILAIGENLPGGDRYMRARVVESGEQLNHRYSEIFDDPRER